MVKNGIVIIADYSKASAYSLDEIMEYLHLNNDFLENLIAYQIIHPQGKQPADWVFDANDIKRIQRAKRLYRDLEINFAGIATVIDLLDELEALRTHSALIERHLLK